MTFSFYIVDPDQGEIFGTDTPDVAKEAAADENLFVVDVENNLFMATPEDYIDIIDIEDDEGNDADEDIDDEGDDE